MKIIVIGSMSLDSKKLAKEGLKLRFPEASIDHSSVMQEAKDKLDSGEYDIVIVNHNLDGGTGMDIISYIKKNVIPYPTIIGFSMMGPELEKLEKAGADYCFRSYESQKLYEILKQFRLKSESNDIEKSTEEDTGLASEKPKPAIGVAEVFEPDTNEKPVIEYVDGVLLDNFIKESSLDQEAKDPKTKVDKLNNLIGAKIVLSVFDKNKNPILALGTILKLVYVKENNQVVGTYKIDEKY